MHTFRKLIAGVAVLALMVLCCTFLPLQAKAETEGDYTYEVSGGEATITEVDTSISGDITIPSTLGGYPVTAIGMDAFAGCSSLESVNIPDSVTSIGYSAFFDCSSLTSVTIGEGVTSIGDWAFYYCSSLTSVTIPDSVTSIGDEAFYYCSNLESVTIGEGVTSIGMGAFGESSSLTSVTIGEGVTSIGDNAFAYCISLESVNIPDSVTSIGIGAFSGCSSLTSVTIGEGVTSIGDGAFEDCSGLESITIPDSVTSIGIGAFDDCSGLTSVTIGEGVTSIGERAFLNCRGLTSVTIPDSVTSIGDEAFFACSSLESVNIPDSVTSIGYSVFYHCSSLTSVNIPDSVTSIGYGAFYDCRSLESVTIGEGVTCIDWGAFSSCDNLETVYYGGSEEQRGQITIDEENEPLTNATWVYHYTDQLEGSLNGLPERIQVGQQATITVNVEEIAEAEFAMIRIDLPAGLKLVSGSWLVDGEIQDFDISTGYGVLGMEEIGALAGDVFQFVVEGQAVGTDLAVEVSFEAKVNDTSVATAEMTAQVDVVVEPKIALNGLPERIQVGQQATVAVNVSDIPNAEFAMVRVQLPAGLRLVSGSWLVEGAIANFDMANGYAVLGMEEISALDGDVFQFVVEGQAVGENQTIEVSFEAKIDDVLVATAETTEQVDVESGLITPQMTLNGLQDMIFAGQQATITVNVSEIPRAEFAMIRVQLPRGLRLVSGNWLANGVIKNFDPNTGYGVLGMEEIGALTGDVFQFVVEGQAVGENQTIRVSFETKVDDVLVATAEATRQVDVEAGLVDATATISGLPASMLTGEQATITVNISEIPRAEFAMIQVKLPEGLKLVSGNWLANGVIKSFDPNTGYGVLGMDEIGALGGDVLQFVVEAQAAGEDLTVEVSFVAKINDVTVATDATTEEVTVVGLHIFLYEDGTVYKQIEAAFGEAFDMPEGPAKAADNTYTYTFKAWEVDGYTYKATYTATYIEYKVTFLNADGSVVSEETYHYGDTIVVPATPSKDADNTYTYTFAGWDTDVSATCQGNVTYKATYDAAYIDYTVKFLNADGSVVSEKTYHYGDTIAVPAAPSKAADNTYTYAFAGWDTDVSETCQGNVTYKATYDATYIDYTVIFKDENGDVISEKTYHYGDTIVVPAAPSKAADNTYTYTFAGWDADVSATCQGNVTYKATYDAAYIDYTIIFKDENGNVISEETYHWNDVIVVPADPTKAADNTYTYTFAGWDAIVSETCQGSVTYKATYDATYIDYTVKFLNADGSVVSEKTYHYGDTIVVPAAPSKAADNTYTYAFAGWDADVSATCQGSVTYKATYDATYIEYTVIFQREDGTILSEKTYHYGDVIAVPDTAKAADNTYTYTFTGWDKEIAATCAGTVTYTASYEAAYIEYKVTFLNADGSVVSEETYHYGDAIAVPADPSKAADNTYTYAFAGWDAIVSEICQGSVTYKATYDATYIEYTVVFYGEDGSVISEKTYHYGDTIVVPAAPSKAADNTYTYTFDGWGADVSATCQGSVTYKATYRKAFIDYTVIFKAEDGSVISEKIYHWGNPILVPQAPNKAADETYTYTPSWGDLVMNCDGDATYTVSYIPTYIDYTVVFYGEDGSVISEKTYHYGDKVEAPVAPSKAADKTYTYAFAGWDKTVGNCAGDAVYTATYTGTYIDYTVIFKNENGDVISEKTYHYGDTIVVPAAPSKAADHMSVYTFTGWDKDVAATCTSDVTYTARYSAAPRTYTILFKNEDGTILSQKTCYWGGAVVAPSNPTKAADNTYTYTFTGWDKEIAAACAGNATYTASYEATYIDYTVKFLDENGDVLGSGTYHFGQEIEVPGAPTKAADNTYTYAFAGWDKTVVNCAGDAVYTATYKATFIEYTVTFRYENGTVISTATYHYGDAIVAPEDPESLTAGYVFAGWDKEIGTCDGNMTFTAKFERSYVLGDVNDDGVVTDKDAVHLLYYTFMPEDYPVNQDCDFNGDGVVTDKDAVHLLYYTFMPNDYPLQ